MSSRGTASLAATPRAGTDLSAYYSPSDASADGYYSTPSPAEILVSGSETQSDSEEEDEGAVSYATAQDSYSSLSKLSESLSNSFTDTTESLPKKYKNLLLTSATGSTTSKNTDGKVTNRQEEVQIQQTNEEHDLKAETDRTKRFEYLLEQTEIWGHFMKRAYEEALNFSSNDKSLQDEKDTIQASESSTLSSAPMAPLASDLTKSKRLRTKKKLRVPDLSSRKGHTNGPKYTTHFDSTPEFISGGEMRDYQVRGLNWLILLYERGLSGILADEMGLGKTLQTISLLGYLKHCREIEGPHLIIAPKSTLSNWMNELKRWCPSLKAVCLIGAKEERRSLIKTNFLRKQWNVCVTSYEIAKIEKSVLKKVNYHFIVIDEAQKIKNENSQLATVTREIHSTARLLLTGTPLQNNLHELWALLNFLLPDVFASAEDFDSWFNESSCMENQTLVERLQAVLRPFLLRRIKADVEKSLPPKTEMRLHVQLTSLQREWYRKVLMNDINVIDERTGRPSRKALQNVIMHLRKVCNHPYLFEGAEAKPYTTGSHLVTNSGKMILLDKLLVKLKAQNSRVLLFSQMTRVLDIIEDYCIWRGFEHCRLDGATNYAVRQEDIDAFNAPNSTKFIFLLSTRAGGLGINLASADIVILFDSDWNPQMDLQAMDRAHRIGQTKEVKVFRLVVQDTMEEKIIERAATKLHLDKMVIQEGRLVNLSSAKGPTRTEMLSVARFGADKILNSNESIKIHDEDIDTILAQSKVRSAEFDRRLNEIAGDNLRNLTIEQVSLAKWKNPEEKENYFNFEGQNYRELRKRKIWGEEMITGKRRRENALYYNEQDTI